jgi:hypothetical protein
MVLNKSIFHSPVNRRPSRHAGALIALALFAFSANAFADWTWLGNDGDPAVYIDAATIRRTGNLASAWTLKDYRQMQTGPSREKFRSAKIYYEFNCPENLMRQSYLTRYHGPMGGGGTFPSDSRFHPWTAIGAGTESAILFGLVCR